MRFASDKGEMPAIKRLRGDVIRAGYDRPFALPLTQRDVMLNNLRLPRIDVKRLPQGIFRRRILLVHLQNAADLLQEPRACA